MARAFQTFLQSEQQLVGLLTGTSWNFSMKVPHLISIRPMEGWLATLNASSAIMSHALEQINAARIGVICESASSAPNCLLSRVQLSICFPISLSPIHLTASLYLWYLCHADCFQEIMFEQARTSHSNNLGFFGHIKTDCFVSTGKWLFWDLPISVGKSTNIALWVLVMPADRRNKMLECWLATRIFCDSVTCFGTNKCCSIESSARGLQQSSPLLACMVTLFLYRKSKVFSGRRYSQHPRLSWP